MGDPAANTGAPVSEPPPPTELAPLHDPQPTTAIEPATGPGEEDEFDIAEAYETNSSASTSVTSSIYEHTYENGRRYHRYKNGRYPLPNDDLEQNREHVKHTMLLELNDGKLFFAPIGDNPQKILDIGTGTGIWAIDIGDRFPSASVRGIDLSPIQPAWVPPNVSFIVDDCEDEWYEGDADFVHFRYMASVLKDLGKVFKHTFKALKPGGWIELQELNCKVECDDGTMPDDDPVKIAYELLDQSFSRFGMDVCSPPKLGPMLQNAGFENIQCTVKKVPIGAWARDKTMRLIGMYQKLAIMDILPSFGGRPFQTLGLKPEEIQVRLALARRSLEESAAHRYCNYYFWYAQKPK